MSLQNLIPAASSTSTGGALAVLQPKGGVMRLEPLETELNFYGSYPWCLNVFPTVGEIRSYLKGELARLEAVTKDWQRNETAINVFLFSCALTQTVDDYLLGRRYDFTKAVAAAPVLASVVPPVELGLLLRRKVRELGCKRLYDWRQRWDAQVIEFTQAWLTDEPVRQQAFSSCSSLLAPLLAQPLSSDLIGRRCRVPSAFHSQSLTHLDALTLARRLVGSFPDRSRPILVLGLRTAGSYFGPVVTAHLKSEGYQQVDCATLRPTTGISSWEAQTLARSAAKGALAVIVDEPMNSGNAVAQAVRFLHQAGFAPGDIVALVPKHPARHGWTWSAHASLSPAPQITLILLDGAEWHKRQLLKPKAVEGHVREYFLRRGYRSVSLGSSPRLKELRNTLRDRCMKKGHIKLKGIYEFHLQDADGKMETRYVLAKSAGWGWLGYHAFLEAHRLSVHVPPLLGLRDGILYSEWLPQEQQVTDSQNREELVRTVGSYVAARVRSLGLGVDPSADLNKEGRSGGLLLLAEALSQAYHHKVTAALKRSRLRERLARYSSPCPTLIDGRMQLVEWIHGPTGLLKTDFEHHGLGKPQLNIADPAYDLAEAILCWDLSPTEESSLLTCYVDNCGDAGVRERLNLYKVLAGTRATQLTLEGLGLPHLSRYHSEFHRRYVQARKFLTSHMTRFCSNLCLRRNRVSWRSPLVVLDIDGVLDAWVFGFASTTKAGIQAVSLLHTHDFAVAVDTARSMAAVQEYCKAYSFVGGVAEYGSALWDAVQNRELVLVDSESLSELEEVKRALRELPGVFLDDRYRYSIRAYRFQDERTLPIPTPIIQNLLMTAATRRLRIHQTASDTAILAQGVGKGTGLQSLLSWVGASGLDTVAIGDSEADLEMFRVAKRSFAPAQTKCREAAQLVGCRIVDRSYQAGLLRIVQSLLHARGHRCKRCQLVERQWPKDKDPLLELLDVADKSYRSSLLKALIDPKSFEAFVK